MIVADTDVLIDFQRGRDPGAAAILAALESGKLATTTVTVFELLSGVRSDGQRNDLRALLGAVRILPLDFGAAQEAALLGRTLGSEGQGLAVADCLIASVCLHHHAPLLTRNRRPFERVPGLILADLASPRRERPPPRKG